MERFQSFLAFTSGTRPAIHGQSDHERAGTRGAWNFSLQSGLLEQWFYLLAHITRDEPSARRDRRPRWSGRKAVAVASSSRLARLALKTSDFGRGGKSEGAGYTVEKKHPLLTVSDFCI